MDVLRKWRVRVLQDRIDRTVRDEIRPTDAAYDAFMKTDSAAVTTIYPRFREPLDRRYEAQRRFIRDMTEKARLVRELDPETFYPEVCARREARRRCLRAVLSVAFEILKFAAFLAALLFIFVVIVDRQTSFDLHVHDDERKGERDPDG